MAGNPLVDQGSLNRLKASVTFQNHPELNVTPPFMNKAGISLALDGEATAFHPTMTGAVTSGEPYVMCTVTMHLLKTQRLAALFKAQLEAQSVLGNCTVRGDTTVHPPYDLINCAFVNPRELGFSGDDASYTVVIRGYYLVNSDLWN